MNNYPADRLKVMALHWLRRQYPAALLTTELAVAKYGDAMLDVAAITESEIIGIEVKGDGDSASRLERQGWVYARAARRMWLLPAPSLWTSTTKKKPRGWGLLEPTGGNLSEYYAADLLPNAPAALVDVLWKPELIKVAAEFGVAINKKSGCHLIADAVAEAVPLGKLRPTVCRFLRERRWSSLPRDGMSKSKIVYAAADALPALAA